LLPIKKVIKYKITAKYP